MQDKSGRRVRGGIPGRPPIFFVGGTGSPGSTTRPEPGRSPGDAAPFGCRPPARGSAVLVAGATLRVGGLRSGGCSGQGLESCQRSATADAYELGDQVAELAFGNTLDG